MSEAASVRPWSDRIRIPLISMALVAFGMGQSLMVTVLPPVGREMGFTEVQIGAIFSMTGFGVMLAAPRWGRLVDSWGRRPVFIFGLFWFCLLHIAFGSVLYIGLVGIASGTVLYSMLILSRVMSGLGSSGIQPACVGLIADTTSSTDRTAGMAVIGTSFALGSILGPSAGALLSGFGLTVPVFFIGICAALVGSIALFTLSEPPQNPHEPRTRPQLSVTDKRIFPFLLAMFCTFAALAMTQQTIAYHLQDLLNLTAAETTRATGLCLTSSAIAVIGVQAFYVRKYRVPPGRLIWTGLPLCLTAFIIIALVKTLALVMVGYVFLGAGFGMVAPALNASLSLSVERYEQGTAAGLFSSAGAFSFSVGPLAGTALYQVIDAGVYWVTFGLILIVIIGMKSVAIPRPKPSDIELPR